MAALLALAVGAPAQEGSERCDREHFSTCLSGVASSATNGAGLRVSATEYRDVARERSGRESQDEQSAMLTETASLAAGDAVGGSVFGLWGSYAYADFDSDFAFQGTSLAYDAHAHTGLVGFDRLFASRYLLGLALGYQSIKTDTHFNGGDQESDGFTIAPYAAILLSDIFSIDVAAGYSPLDYDQQRISAADGTDVEASFDADRWFAAANLNAVVTHQNWVFGARVGYLHSAEEQDAYTESASAATVAAGRFWTIAERDIDLSQVVASVDIGYGIGAFEPYVMASYYNDLSRDDDPGAGGLPPGIDSAQPDDDDEVQLHIGLRYYTSWGVTSALEYQRVEGRSHFDSDTVMLTVRAAL